MAVIIVPQQIHDQIDAWACMPTKEGESEMKVEFKTGNAAFEDPAEVGRILRMVATQIDNGKISGAVQDCNGNKVGKFKR